MTVETLHERETPELNQGMGRFEFTPGTGHRRYELKIDVPVGVRESHACCRTSPDGVVLSVPHGVIGFP